MHDGDSIDLLPPLSEGEKVELETIFNQPFYFFGNGGQCYAFISEDNRTVLKLFKNHHLRLWKFLNHMPLPNILEAFRQKLLLKHLHCSPAFFESCKISYLEFRERTGLIYLHLHKTDHFKKKVTIVDNLEISHQIDLNSIDFALQNKIELAHPMLRKWIENGHLDDAKQCLESILDLIVERCHKQIRDRDPNFRTNIGFIGDLAVEIDIGSYSKDESLGNREGFKEELLDSTHKLKCWLERKNKDLSLYFSERIDQVLEEK
jgi:hypothetical protein